MFVFVKVNGRSNALFYSFLSSYFIKMRTIHVERGVALSVVLTFVMNEGDGSLTNSIWETGVFVESITVHVGARLQPCDEKAFQSF
jgi:hypothetical protein